MSSVLVPVVVAIGVLSLARPTDAACTPLMDLIKQQKGYEAFGHALEATQTVFSPDLKYTVLLPEDGALESGVGGEAGFAGLLRSYKIDPTSAATISESPKSGALGGFVKYSIIPGAYTEKELKAQLPINEIRTMFDPETDGFICTDPNGAISNKKTDGDLKFEAVDDGNTVGIEDDSPNTPVARIVKGDLMACGGSIVHLMDGYVNPCCAEKDTCESSELEPKQVDPVADNDEASASGSGFALLVVPAVLLLAML